MKKVCNNLLKRTPVIALIALGGSFIGSNAFASKARLNGLETGGTIGNVYDGSLFINDARNVFLNPAYINELGNQINLEWGPTQTPSPSTGTVNPELKAEGGFAVEGENLNYGLQIGRTGFAARNLRNVSRNENYDNGTTNFFMPQNAVEFIVGGETDIKWGASVYFANSENENAGTTGNRDFPDSNGRILTAKGGMIKDKFQVFGHLDVLHNSETDESAAISEEVDGSVSVRLGGSYELNEDAKIGGLVSYQNQDTRDSSSAEAENTDTAVLIEYFRNMKKTENSLVYYKFGLLYLDGEYDISGAGSASTGILALPLTIGVESAMTDWLLLRGSVNQRVIIDRQTSEVPGAEENVRDGLDDTTVAAGVGLLFQGFQIDALLEGARAQTGNVDSNELLARVGLNYTF